MPAKVFYARTFQSVSPCFGIHLSDRFSTKGLRIIWTFICRYLVILRPGDGCGFKQQCGGMIDVIDRVVLIYDDNGIRKAFKGGEVFVFFIAHQSVGRLEFQNDCVVSGRRPLDAETDFHTIEKPLDDMEAACSIFRLQTCSPSPSNAAPAEPDEFSPAKLVDYG